MTLCALSIKSRTASGSPRRRLIISIAFVTRIVPKKGQSLPAYARAARERYIAIASIPTAYPVLNDDVIV